MFVDVQCQSEQREQALSKRNRGMAAVKANQANKRKQEDGEQILIIHYFVSEAGQPFRPDVFSIEAVFVMNGECGRVLPTNVETFVKVSSVLRVRILS